MNAQQAAMLWVASGGPTGIDPHTNLPIPQLMGAVAVAESSGVAAKVGGPNKDKSFDYGLWQVNGKAWPQYHPGLLLSNQTYNAQAAIHIYTVQGVTAWSAFNNGNYAKYLPVGTIAPGMANAWPTTTPASNITPVTNTLTAIFGEYGHWITSTNVNVLYKGIALCLVLVVASTIKPISKFVLWAAVAILFLLIIQKSNADNLTVPLYGGYTSDQIGQTSGGG